MPTWVGRRLAGELHADHAVVADGDALRAVGNRDARLQPVAARGDELALRDQSGSCRRACRRSVPSGMQHLEEAAALDRDDRARCRSVSGCPACSCFSVATTRTPVPSCKPGRRLGVLRGRQPPTCVTFWYSRSSNTARLLLEAVGVDVGEVVGRDRHARLLRVESGLGGPECWIHVRMLL